MLELDSWPHLVMGGVEQAQTTSGRAGRLNMDAKNTSCLFSLTVKYSFVFASFGSVGKFPVRKGSMPSESSHRCHRSLLLKGWRGTVKALLATSLAMGVENEPDVYDLDLMFSALARWDPAPWSRVHSE